jgi:hypothetical protein
MVSARAGYPPGLSLDEGRPSVAKRHGGDSDSATGQVFTEFHKTPPVVVLVRSINY